MSMQKITKKCPYCGKVYEERSCGSLFHKPSPEDVWQYGSPMKLCPHCKKVFIDQDTKELATVSLRKQDTAKFTSGTLLLLPLGLLLCVFFSLVGQNTFAFIAIGIAAFYALMDLCFYPYRMKKLNAERKASEERLSDPEYAAALKKAGIDIPGKYLKKG